MYQFHRTVTSIEVLHTTPGSHGDRVDKWKGTGETKERASRTLTRLLLVSIAPSTCVTVNKGASEWSEGRCWPTRARRAIALNLVLNAIRFSDIDMIHRFRSTCRVPCNDNLNDQAISNHYLANLWSLHRFHLVCRRYSKLALLIYFPSGAGFRTAECFARSYLEIYLFLCTIN